MQRRRKIAVGIIIGTISLMLILPLTVVTKVYLFPEADWLLSISEFFFVNLYFTILPGALLIAIAIYYWDIINPDVKGIATVDYIWIALWLVGILFFSILYSAGPDSIFNPPGQHGAAEPAFLDALYVRRHDGALATLGPGFHSLLLNWSFQFIFVATIFLFGTINRLGYDRKVVGILLVNILIAFQCAIFLTSSPFYIMEEAFTSIMYQNLRDPSTQVVENYPMTHDNRAPVRYCTPPDAKLKLMQSNDLLNEVNVAAYKRGLQEGNITKPFTPIPAPPGLRDDIEIIGVTTSDIITVNFEWPLDWEIYAGISNRLASFENAILVYDINFVDIKGISGGSKCNDPDNGFKCTPFPGKPLLNQTETLMNSFKNNRNQVLADYPIYTDDKNRPHIKNFHARLALLKNKTGIKNIKNAEHAIIWAVLPESPVVPIAATLDHMGHANVFIDPRTKVNNKVPLVIRVVNEEKAGALDYDPNKHDDYYPGIALASAVAYYGVDPIDDLEVDFLNGYVKINNIPRKSFQRMNWEKDPPGMEEVDIMTYPNEERSVTIPMDQMGLMDINFRGGLYCFPNKPILDVAWDWQRRERERVKRFEAERKQVAKMSRKDFADYASSQLPQLLEYRMNFLVQLALRGLAAQGIAVESFETILNTLDNNKALTAQEKKQLKQYQQWANEVTGASGRDAVLALTDRIQKEDPELYDYLLKKKYRVYSPEEKQALIRNDLDGLKARYEKKIALIAMYYATGVDTAKDVHLSPYGTMAGIEHQAMAINTILNQDFVSRSAGLMDLGILLILAIGLGLAFPRLPTALTLTVSILVILIYAAITMLFSFQLNSYIHIFPTAIVEQILILISFIGFRVFAEEENVKYIRNTFSKFVAQDVVDELLNNPEAMALGGAKKEVSVFFSDVRGFTTISEKLGPEELVQLLNEYLTVMTDLIINYRGTIDKYMGDAIMAFWGAPVQNDDHAYYTCVATIAQVNALKEMQVEWSARGVPALDIGCGINTGGAVVGNMGSSARMDYTLMGDTVNLGSRLEGITKQYGVKIVISEYTYERVKDRVFARELDLVRVKGKLEPVRIYELMGLRNESDLETLKTAAKEGAAT